jgi:hypothetical protein
MHKILVSRIYFPLRSLHISDCISPFSGEIIVNFTSYLVYDNTSGCCVVIGSPSYNHISAGRMVSAYTKYDVKFTNISPEKRLIQSEICRDLNGK